jgi:carbon storage regulator
MLILSRKANEKIMIGDDISITIMEIRGDQIRVGVEAPKNVKVYRQEVFNAIKDENRAAVLGGDGKIQSKLPVLAWKQTK